MEIRYFEKLNRILADGARLLAAFGLSREQSTVVPREFPYQFAEADMEGVFKQNCPSYDGYMEFLESFNKLVHATERESKVLKYDGRWNFAFQSDFQSYHDRLGNLTAQLIWLRRAGKAWRRRVKASLKEK